MSRPQETPAAPDTDSRDAIEYAVEFLRGNDKFARFVTWHLRHGKGDSDGERVEAALLQMLTEEVDYLDDVDIESGRTEPWNNDTPSLPYGG